VERMKESDALVDAANTGMGTFQPKTRYLKYEKFFHHMVHRRLCDPTNKPHDPIPYVDVKSEHDRLEKFSAHKTDLGSSKIMTYFHVTEAEMRLTTRKLENFGYIESYCGVHNDPKSVGKLKTSYNLKLSWHGRLPNHK
jgi:hypothetical protein